MENPKYSPEEQKWAEDLVHKLSVEFPDANIHTDEEYFIYDVISPTGEHVEMHTPKWKKIPFQNSDDSVTGVDAEDEIRSRLSEKK